MDHATESCKAVGRRRAPIQRIQLACDPCKSAKLKCDRRLPTCEQCYKRLREPLCKYTERGLRYLTASENASAIREKLARVETFVNRVASSDAPDSLRPVRNAPEIANCDVHGQNIASSDVPGGKLRLQSDGGTQWVNGAHWESMVEDIADVRAYLDFLELNNGVQNLYSGSAETFVASSVPIIDMALSTSSDFSITSLVSALPSREEMDRLIAAWFNAADPIRAIVHGPTFQTQYQEFWCGQQYISAAWLALLAFTASLGAEMVRHNLGETSMSVLSDQLINLGARALVHADSAKPQPFIIEALTYYALVRLYRSHDADSQTWQILGHTMRLCYQAGYHRDPSGNPRISLFECEMRRRLWMVVSELEIQVGSGLGTISWREPKVCDTALPANLDDLDLSPHHISPPRPPEDCTLIQVEICVSRLVQVLGEITASYHTVKPPTKHEVATLSQKLEHTRSSLPEKLKIKPLEHSFIDSPTLIIDRLRLEFSYLRAVCLLYRRYLGDEQYPQERDRRIRAASSTVELSVSMLTLCQPGRQLALSKAMIIRHIHDFNFAAVLLCTELKHGKARPPALDFHGTPGYADLALLRPKLLTACQLWNNVITPSQKTSVALRAIITYLQGGPSPGDASQPESDLDLVGVNIPYPWDAYGYSALSSSNLLQTDEPLNEFLSNKNEIIYGQESVSTASR